MFLTDIQYDSKHVTVALLSILSAFLMFLRAASIVVYILVVRRTCQIVVIVFFGLGPTW